MGREAPRINVWLLAPTFHPFYFPFPAFGLNHRAGVAILSRRSGLSRQRRDAEEPGMQPKAMTAQDEAENNRA